ncbi:multicopper oxidase, partial [Ramaria rubella]
MSFARPPQLALSLLIFLLICWSLVHKDNLWQRVGDWRYRFTLNVDAPFDARLIPEAHASRPAKTLELNWVVRKEIRFPDGVEKPIYTVNGLFPGPTVEARPGDRILLRVRNEIEKEGTAIHFHGIRQLGSNSMDGAPGLTQCPIQPNHTFLYNFTISEKQTGTYWWHSHSAHQRADGLFGAFVVHDPVEDNQTHIDVGHSNEDLRIRAEKSSYSERLLLIGDWYHKEATAMFAWYMSKKSQGFEPAPETALFNGVDKFDCSRASRFVNCDPSKGRIPSLFLDPHYRTRLRLVNTGNLADLEVAIGSHSLVVIEADGSRVVPHRVNSIVVSPGQRYSVIVEPHSSIKPRKGDSFWLRLSMDPDCCNIPSNSALDMVRFVRIFYGDARTTQSSGPTPPFALDSELPEFDLYALAPVHKTPLPPPDQQIMIYVNSMKLDRLGGVPYGFVNHTSWAPAENEPLLLRDTAEGIANGWGEHQLVVTTHRKEMSVIELIVNNLDDGPHPFHLHGHHFYPLHTYRAAYGWGAYNYTTGHVIPEEAPVLRDTIIVPRHGNVVIRFLADAPGMWLFHCHILVHLSAGMAMTFNVRPDLVSNTEKQAVLAACEANFR